jgi:hypothetical protein
VIDLGPMGKAARKGRRVKVTSATGAPVKGWVQPSAPWIALSMREFAGSAADLTIAARQRGLKLARFQWRVPNLFALLPRGLWRALTRSSLLRWLLPVLLVVGAGVLLTQRPIAALALAAGLLLGMATGITQLWLWLVAVQVGWFVPAPRQNIGYVQVDTQGGGRRLVEVRVLARPGFLRAALGWLLVSLLLIAELVGLGWLILYWPF